MRHAFDRREIGQLQIGETGIEGALRMCGTRVGSRFDFCARLCEKIVLSKMYIVLGGIPSWPSLGGI